MIKVIVGQKGTGKTKKLIDLANQALHESKGQIVFIDGDDRRIMELNHKIRFINSREFCVNDFKVLYGFLSGIIAQNYDIDKIYIDGLLDIAGQDFDAIEKLMFDIKKLSDTFDIGFIITMSGDPRSVPDFLKEYIA